MDEQLQGDIYTGLEVDLLCKQVKPTFGQLFKMLRGETHPFFPADIDDFGHVSELEFDQVDDYWGIRNPTETGDDVIVWLFPLIDGIDVYHEPGPFDGVRLSYSVLRNPVPHIAIYLNAITVLTRILKATVLYRTREQELEPTIALTMIEADANQIAEYWRRQGIEPGSEAALRLDY